jgi:hypothetical protein
MKNSKNLKARTRITEKKHTDIQPPVSLNTIGEETHPDEIEKTIDEQVGDGEISDNNPENFTIDEDRYAFGFSFAAQDGSSGSENEDTGDLPLLEKKVGQHYDETLSAGDEVRDSMEEDEISSSMHVADAEDIGMSYGEDKYVQDEEAD